MLRKVTIDTNCIIDLEENRDSAPFVRQLADASTAGQIILRAVAISASERKPGGVYAISFSEFQTKLDAVGLRHIEILLPMAYYGIFFWGHCLWPGDEMVKLEQEIHEILFPNIEFDYAKYCEVKRIPRGDDEPLDPKWRNPKCDVQAMWSHIHHDGDVFVTSDGNFHKVSKRERLIALGARSIMVPEEAATAIG